MTPVSEIKLIRTDTTLDLSQKAEKVCFKIVHFVFLLYNHTSALMGRRQLNKISCPPQSSINTRFFIRTQLEDLCQFLLGKAYTYLRFATILQRILAEHMCALRRSGTCLGDESIKKMRKNKAAKNEVEKVQFINIIWIEHGKKKNFLSSPFFYNWTQKTIPFFFLAIFPLPLRRSWFTRFRTFIEKFYGFKVFPGGLTCTDAARRFASIFFFPLSLFLPLLFYLPFCLPLFLLSLDQSIPPVHSSSHMQWCRGEKISSCQYFSAFPFSAFPL